MKPTILTWNGNNIASGTFAAYIPPIQMANHSQNVVLVNRANDYPFLSAAQKIGNAIQINVIIRPGYDINTYREVLKGYFFSDLKKHDLVVADENDSNKQYYRTGIPSMLVQESVERINSFLITIPTEYQYWQLVTASVDSWDITASGDSDTITVIGNQKVPPIFTFTPTTTKSAGLKYRRYVTMYNNMDKSYTAPTEITNGGLDVQALIDANKMQASGNDFLVWEDSAFRNRWLSGMDSDSDPAKCWTNESLAPRAEGLTSATFDSDDTSMSFSQTRDNLSFLRSLRMVFNKALLIDSEVVTYSDSDVDTIAYTLSNLARGQKDTTAVSHLSGSIVRHLEHDPWILYGDSDAGTPDIDDNYKPMPDLTSSNQVWTYTNYYDYASTRLGGFKGEVLSTRTGLSYTFTDSDPTVSTNPSTKLGLAEIGTQSTQNPLGETATIDWMTSHPCGITDAGYTGEIYRTASWPAVVGLQYLLPNTTWITAQNEVQPSVANTWESTGARTVSLGGTYETIRFAMDGSLSASAGEQALAQFHTVSLTFDSDNLPTVSLGAEASINFFDIKLTNGATGEYIKIQTPCPVNATLTVDCESKRAYLSDGTPVAVTFSSTRDAWLDLAPGANALVYEDTGTVAVHVNITHRDRVL